MQFEDEVRTVRPWPVNEDSHVADRIATVRNRGIIHGGEMTRRHFVALGRTPKDGKLATGKDLRGSGTLIKWKDRPFILTCGHVLRACGLPDNETTPWRLWIVFGGKTETNETMAGPLTILRNNWWARGVDARAGDTAGPDIALVAVPYQWAIDAEGSDKANVQFHDVEQVGTMSPPEHATSEDDLTEGIVLHLCGGWHGELQTEVDSRYKEGEPIATGFSMNLGWPNEWAQEGWSYGNYPIIGQGITQRLIAGRGSPEGYQNTVKTPIGGGWGGFSGTGVWRIECDPREGARGASATMSGVVFAEIGDDEFSREIPIGLKAHSRDDIFKALQTAHEAGLHSNEEW